MYLPHLHRMCCQQRIVLLSPPFNRHDPSWICRPLSSSRDRISSRWFKTTRSENNYLLNIYFMSYMQYICCFCTGFKAYVNFVAELFQVLSFEVSLSDLLTVLLNVATAVMKEFSSVIWFCKITEKQAVVHCVFGWNIFQNCCFNDDWIHLNCSQLPSYLLFLWGQKGMSQLDNIVYVNYS